MIFGDVKETIAEKLNFCIQGDAFNLRHSNISKNKHTTKKC